MMMPFSPNPFGLSKGTTMNMLPGTTNIRTIYEGQLWLYMSGDITYDKFVENVEAGLTNPQNGIRRLWYSEWENLRNNHRNNERMLATQKIRAMFKDDKSAGDKFVRGVFKVVSTNNANGYRSDWARIHPDEPYPDF
jgi:hypothetical protein